MNVPLISIVVLCYNTGNRIIATLNSILSQSYNNWELIIVDDHSTDDSIQHINSWLIENPRVQANFIINEKNNGIGKSLNRAISVCKGDYLTLIGDDEWAPKYLEDFSRILMNAPKSVAFVTSKVNVIDKLNNEEIVDVLDAKKHISQIQYPYVKELFSKMEKDVYLCKQPYFFDSLFWANPVVAFCVMIRLDYLKDVGFFSEEYLMEDFPTWYKLATKFDMIYIDRIYGNYNRYSTNISTERGQMIVDQVKNIRISYYSKILLKRTKLKVCNEIIDSIIGERRTLQKLLLIMKSKQLQRLFKDKLSLRFGI